MMGLSSLTGGTASAPKELGASDSPPLEPEDIETTELLSRTPNSSPAMLDESSFSPIASISRVMRNRCLGDSLASISGFKEAARERTRVAEDEQDGEADAQALARVLSSTSKVCSESCVAVVLAE